MSTAEWLYCFSFPSPNSAVKGYKRLLPSHIQVFTLLVVKVQLMITETAFIFYHPSCKKVLIAGHLARGRIFKPGFNFLFAQQLLGIQTTTSTITSHVILPILTFTINQLEKGTYSGNRIKYVGSLVWSEVRVQDNFWHMYSYYYTFQRLAHVLLGPHSHIKFST